MVRYINSINHYLVQSELQYSMENDSNDDHLWIGYTCIHFNCSLRMTEEKINLIANVALAKLIKTIEIKGKQISNYEVTWKELVIMLQAAIKTEL